MPRVASVNPLSKGLPAKPGLEGAVAAGCRFSKARLEREGITFKQTPYAIRTK